MKATTPLHMTLWACAMVTALSSAKRMQPKQTSHAETVAQESVPAVPDPSICTPPKTAVHPQDDMTIATATQTSSSEAEATALACNKADDSQSTTPSTKKPSELISITNTIDRSKIPYESKWGTFTPSEFDVTLTVRIAPGETISIPRELLQNGNVDVECAFTFKKGFYTRSENCTEPLTAPRDPNAEFNLAFRWDKPRFSLQTIQNDVVTETDKET